MSQYAYSPDTGELINTATPAAWMSTTPIAPPAYDPTTSGCFLRSGAWVIVAADLLTPAKTEQNGILTASFQAAMTLPVPFTNAVGVASSYPNQDTISFNGKMAGQNLQAVLSAGSAAWTFGHWLDTNGVAQVFTFADLQGLAAAMSAQDTPSELNLVAKFAQVQAATTVAAVQLVVW